ncbi:MAG: hypothetical protein ACFFG0_26800 [Candidatus Thorarchaeota archaeon]
MKKYKKKRKNKKQFNILIFFFVIIIISFLISCTNKKVQTQEENITTKKVQTQEENITTKKVQIEEIDVLDCTNLTPEICDLVKENPSLKQCINRDNAGQYFCIALIKKDASYCDGIEIISKKIQCKAFVSNKPELCADLEPGLRDSCYQDYGLNKRDKEACEKIENKNKRNSCLAVATLNVELCKDIDNEGDKSVCVVSLAEFTRNKALCELLVDKESCYEDLEWMK